MLTRAQMSKLDDWLHTLIQSAADEAERRRAVVPNEVVEERQIDNKTYRLQGVRCGKERCKCAAGELHGPYWYAYWSEQGKTRSQYVGKKLPRRKK
ncbi:MAG: hypothetical protein M3261_02150 [Thermoproteota archaeon]|nr:hypothetical protein [Thermoproteota archaeon]